MKDAVIKLSELNQDQVKLLRQLCGNVITQLDGVDVAEIGEPLLTMFQQLKGEYNAILSKLPPTDMVPAAQEAYWNLNSFVSCLTSTQALLSYMTQRMGDVSKKVAVNSQEVANQVAAKVQETIDAKVKAGELVPKDAVTSLCSAAKDLGMKEAREEAARTAEAEAAKAATIAARKQILSTNGLPLPDNEAALLGTDEEFKSAQERVAKQTKVLVGYGVALNSRAGSSAWLPEDEFGRYEDFLSAAAKKPAADEAFAGGGTPSTADKGARKRIIV